MTRAGLPSIGVVDRPAFASAQGIELRRALTNPASNTGGIMQPAPLPMAVAVPLRCRNRETGAEAEIVVTLTDAEIMAGNPRAARHAAGLSGEGETAILVTATTTWAP